MYSFKIRKIDKRNGGVRIIYIPSKYDSERLQNLLPSLQKIYENQINQHSNHAYAFIKQRNCAMMAAKHIGFQYTLSMDIEDFFDSITEHHLTKFVPKSILDYCLVEGAPRQGLSTSPILSNIAFIPIDELIVDSLERLGIPAVYTRYADDLVFSFNRREFLAPLRKQIELILEVYGFKLNSKKTKIQSASNGRRIITGIGVDEYGIYPTRKTLRKIRAARHQMNVRSLDGLRQWAQCNFPIGIAKDIVAPRQKLNESRNWFNKSTKIDWYDDEIY